MNLDESYIGHKSESIIMNHKSESSIMHLEDYKWLKFIKIMAEQIRVKHIL